MLRRAPPTPPAKPKKRSGDKPKPTVRVEWLGPKTLSPVMAGVPELKWGDHPKHNSRDYYNAEDTEAFADLTLGSLKVVPQDHRDAGKPAFKVTSLGK